MTLSPYRGGSAEVVTGPKGEVANARLVAHSAMFEPKLHRVTDRVFCVIGHGLSNSTAIVAPDGLIVVDTGEGEAEAAEQRDAFGL